MNIKQFQIQSTRTAPFNADPQNFIENREILGNYPMGLVGEFLEYEIELDKVDIDSDDKIPMKLVNSIENEIGDVMHYAVNLLTVLKVEADEEVIKSGQAPTAVQVTQALCDILEIPKKHIYHGHDFDKEKFVDSIYTVITHFYKTYNYAMDDILEKNIEKLKKRYPNKFNSVDSIKRVDMQ